MATIATGVADPSGELSIAAGAGSIWLLTDSAGTLSRIDPAGNAVVARIPVRSKSYAAAFGFGSVWITNTAAGSIQRIDPIGQRVTATIPVGPTPQFLAVGAGAVWTLNQGDGTVTRVDPVTNRVAAIIPVGVAGTGGNIAAGAGRVWVRATRRLLSAIDPANDRVVARYGPPAGSGAVRASDRLVWVTAHDIHKVWIIRL